MQSQPFVQLAGITLRVNNRILFRHTNWTFLRNQNWALIGRNGSGKTLLARALVKSPDLLLLDEPCQGLDLAHRKTFLRIIEALLQQPATTIIYVTHRLDEIPEGIQRLLKLKNGRAIKSRLRRHAG